MTAVSLVSASYVAMPGATDPSSSLDKFIATLSVCCDMYNEESMIDYVRSDETYKQLAAIPSFFQKLTLVKYFDQTLEKLLNDKRDRFTACGSVLTLTNVLAACFDYQTPFSRLCHAAAAMQYTGRILSLGIYEPGATLDHEIWCASEQSWYQRIVDKALDELRKDSKSYIQHLKEYLKAHEGTSLEDKPGLALFDDVLFRLEPIVKTESVFKKKIEESKENQQQSAVSSATSVGAEEIEKSASSHG